MSKTLTLKKIDVVADSSGAAKVTFEEPAPEAPKVQPFTADQLRAMLAELEPGGIIPTDPTMDLPITPTDPAEFAAKAGLPPPDDRASGAVQLPAGVYGKFGLNGIPLLTPQVNLNETINPATGLPYIQVGTRPKTQISPPPSRNFR